MARALKGQSLGGFAFVMATGIISTALWFDHAKLLSVVMLWIGLVAYAVLWVVHLVRLARWPKLVLAEVTGLTAFSSLAIVAASNVLSARLAITGEHRIALLLFAVGAVTWIGLGYGVPLAMIMHAHRHTSLNPVNGTWFMWVVGTQSVSVAAAWLSVTLHDRTLGIIAGACWAIGLLQYLLLAPLELARLLLRRIRQRESVAPYWVFMGSAAITILAGAQLVTLKRDEPALAAPVVAALSTVLWSFATWLVPLLLGLGVLRTIRRHAHVDYRTEWWAIVFPVGMYGVATRELGLADKSGWLVAIGEWDAWVALVVWCVVVLMLGLLEKDGGQVEAG